MFSESEGKVNIINSLRVCFSDDYDYIVRKFIIGSEKLSIKSRVSCLYREGCVCV